MQCENCGEAEAVVHLTQIENNEMATKHLCEKCAAAKGLETIQPPENFPLSDFLAQMGDPSEGAETAAPTDPCDFCGLTFAGFRETGRLGCPHCYTTFEFHLRGVLRRVHGSTRHTGKVYLIVPPCDSGYRIVLVKPDSRVVVALEKGL